MSSSTGTFASYLNASVTSASAPVAVILSIPNGEILEGSLKSNKLKLVYAWMEIHQEELMANWALAIKGERVFNIDPLK